MKTTNLDKWLYLVRRIEEHREEKAVKELQKVYKGLIRDLRKVMGNLFADYADPETGRLRYAELHRQGLDARLLEEVAANVNSVTQDERRIIMETVEQTYANCYSGMVQAVERAVDNDELKEAFSSVEAVKPEVLRAAVNNPVHGLTLSDQLEKNRADIVWGIKQAVGVGLSEGDNYTTMAKRIQKELIGPDGAGGSYYKAVRIARTEAHRVREEGNLDAAQELTEKLEPAGITMVKTWHTMKDERVRPNRARRTKKGWKYSRGGKYDHQKMEGVQVPINEEFTLPSGAKTQAPGKSGVAGEDINCRCFLSYDVVQGTEMQYKMNLQLHAFIPDSKLVSYALDPERDPDKARVFKSALGYTKDNYRDLKDNIMAHIVPEKFHEAGDNGWGMRYNQVVKLSGPNGKTANVMTAWIWRDNDYHLTSLYVTRKEADV